MVKFIKIRTVINTEKLVNILFDDEFNDPTYSGDYGGGGSSAGDYAGDAAYYAKEGAAAAKKGAKKLIPIIILAIIALVVVGFIFSFLGSQQTINFTIKELDGKTVTGARLIVEDSSGNDLLNKSGSNHTLTLGPGTYPVRVTSSTHKSYTESITILQMDGDERDNSYTAWLEKNLEGTLEIILSETEIYEKQTIVGEIRINNTGDAMDDEEMLVGNDTSSALENDINFSPAIFDVSSGGTRIIEFAMTLNKNISETKTDEDIEFRIKGTTISKSQKITLVPAIPAREINFRGDIDNKIIKDHKLTSGEQKDIEFEIENENRNLPLKDVTLTIIPDNGYEDKLSWFEFSEAGSKNHIATINFISPDAKEPITLRVIPSIDAKVEDKFKGTLKIESLGIQERLISVNLDFMVEKQKQAGLEFKVKDFSTDCYTSGADCDELDTIDQISIKNNGDIAIGTINLGIDTASSAPDCPLWIEYINDTITGLDIGAEKPIALNIIVTPGTTREFTGCYLKAAYVDPLTGKTNVDISGPIKIKVSTKNSP